MPAHDGSGSNQDERLTPPGPEHSQGNPEQFVQGSQSTARSLRVQSQQLLMESQVLKDELLMGAESAEQPAEQMSERHDHVRILPKPPEFSFVPSHSFCRCTTFCEAQHSRRRDSWACPVTVVLVGYSYRKKLMATRQTTLE